MNIKHHLLAGLLLCASAEAGLATNVTNAPADFTITSTVAAPAVERFGANLQFADFNNFTLDPGMEPTILRHLFVATGGGADFIVNDSGPTTSWYDTIGDNFFNGAAVRVYRISDGAVHLVQTNVVRQYFASTNSGHRIQLENSAEPVTTNDFYFLEMTAVNAPVESVDPRLPYARYGDTWQPIGGSVWPFGLSVTNSRDASTFAPENGGYSSMTLSTEEAHEVSLRQYAYGARDSFLPSLEPGRLYRVDVWLRQEGVADSAVRFQMDSSYQAVSHTWTNVSGTWQKFSFDFTAPERPQPDSSAVQNIIGFMGPGKIWIDNLFVYDPSLPPFAVRPGALEALRDYRPGFLRIWSGVNNTYWGTSVEDWTNPDALAQVQWQANTGRSGPEAAFKLPTALSICKQIDATPWLIVSSGFSEQEWRDLFEYLAGPAGTPYGDKRIAQGQSNAWTDEFPRLRIEFANETWNPAFEWGFPNGLASGAFAEYFFRQAKSSPYFAAISNKVDFIVNGWLISPDPTGFGAGGIVASPSSSLTDVAVYIGGWEVGIVAGDTNITDRGFQNFMLYAPTYVRHFVDRHVATRDYFASQGRPYNLAAYEGGPGYGLPSPGHVFDPVAEAYGKSLAGGVSTLDTYLYDAYRGFGPQAYFLFGPGYNWFSHTPIDVGFRPHLAWLALQLGNRGVIGDMLVTAINGAPTADVPAYLADPPVPATPNTPLVVSYAFRDGSNYSVFVLSRRVAGDTPVTLRLPFTSVSEVRRVQLAGDPRVNNIDALNLTIEETAVTNFSQNFTFAMPPGSIYLFQFLGAATSVETNPSVTISRALGQESSTSLPVVRFAVNFSQPVTGFDSSDVLVSGASGLSADSILVTELEPRFGMTYEVAISGMTASGIVRIDIPGGSVSNSVGQLNTAAIPLANEVEYTVPPPRHVLFAWDSFNLAPSETPTPPFLNGVATGAGWSQPWQAQNFDAGYTNGYRLANANPLRFGALQVAGSYGVGGRLYEGLGRSLDVEGAFYGLRVVNSNPSRIGQSGTTLWISFLLRKDAAPNAPGPYVSLVDSPFGWDGSTWRISAGYFGPDSIENGTPFWSLAINNATNGAAAVFRAPAPVVIGESVLLVLRIQFGARDQVELFVNPANLGEAQPPNASVAWIADPGGPDVSFRTLGFYAGPSETPGIIEGSFDEPRFGDSFAAVTPTASSAWRQLHFDTPINSGPAADGADPDGDGILNIIEYALGENPWIPSTNAFPAARIESDHFTLRFHRNPSATDVNWEVQSSPGLMPSEWTFFAGKTGLGPWTSLSNVVIEETPSGAVTILDSNPSANRPSGYFRIRVGRP
jgi:hypothetical protein